MIPTVQVVHRKPTEADNGIAPIPRNTGAKPDKGSVSQTNSTSTFSPLIHHEKEIGVAATNGNPNKTSGKDNSHKDAKNGVSEEKQAENEIVHASTQDIRLSAENGSKIKHGDVKDSIGGSLVEAGTYNSTSSAVTHHFDKRNFLFSLSAYFGCENRGTGCASRMHHVDRSVASFCLQPQY